MKATKEQKKYIHTNTPNRDTKEEFVQWATNDNDKISTNDLTFNQANQIIKALGGKPYVDKNGFTVWGYFNMANSQHKQILSLCQQYGWQTLNTKTGRSHADIAKLGQWLQSDRAPVNKPLKKMDAAELTKTINALTAMAAKKYK